MELIAPGFDPPAEVGGVLLHFEICQELFPRFWDLKLLKCLETQFLAQKPGDRLTLGNVRIRWEFL